MDGYWIEFPAFLRLLSEMSPLPWRDSLSQEFLVTSFSSWRIAFNRVAAPGITIKMIIDDIEGVFETYNWWSLKSYESQKYLITLINHLNSYQTIIYSHAAYMNHMSIVHKQCVPLMNNTNFMKVLTDNSKKLIKLMNDVIHMSLMNVINLQETDDKRIDIILGVGNGYFSPLLPLHGGWWVNVIHMFLMVRTGNRI